MVGRNTLLFRVAGAFLVFLFGSLAIRVELT